MDIGECDVHVWFMKRTAGGLSTWPNEPDLAYQPVEDIISVLSPPNLVNERKQFRFSESDIQSVQPKSYFGKRSNIYLVVISFQVQASE